VRCESFPRARDLGAGAFDFATFGCLAGVVCFTVVFRFGSRDFAAGVVALVAPVGLLALAVLALIAVFVAAVFVPFDSNSTALTIGRAASS
jgi:hypothetical protein